MTDTITAGFTHLVVARDGERTTTNCGRTFPFATGWLDQGMICPPCHNLPDTIHGVSPDPREAVTYKQRTK